MPAADAAPILTTTTRAARITKVVQSAAQGLRPKPFRR